ncbi:unnamed protein product [Owenia fusiformis]|uniref:Uncharacterized protein n=1 Tax=Owenia fusiformis TaxID=6347 RepID=A0A8J1UK37_OWEFU|nr:unnamed protein product [Owenia fusiformis]
MSPQMTNLWGENIHVDKKAKITAWVKSIGGALVILLSIMIVLLLSIIGIQGTFLLSLGVSGIIGGVLILVDGVLGFTPVKVDCCKTLLLIVFCMVLIGLHVTSCYFNFVDNRMHILDEYRPHFIFLITLQILIIFIGMVLFWTFLISSSITFPNMCTTAAGDKVEQLENIPSDKENTSSDKENTSSDKKNTSSDKDKYNQTGINIGNNTNDPTSTNPIFSITVASTANHPFL